MTTHKTLSLSNTLYEYLLSVSVHEPSVLQELRKETTQDPMAKMQIAPDQGQFMALLVELINAKKALEIGVFTGYSSIRIAQALPPDGQLIACDIDKKWTDIAQRYWKKANVEKKIELILAPAINTLDELISSGHKESFDFIFIDADKINYDNYFERSLTLLRQGGLIVIDNVLWSGSVADPNFTDDDTNAIRAFNKKLHQDERITLSLVSMADGLTLALKRFRN